MQTTGIIYALAIYLINISTRKDSYGNKMRVLWKKDDEQNKNFNFPINSCHLIPAIQLAQ